MWNEIQFIVYEMDLDRNEPHGTKLYCFLYATVESRLRKWAIWIIESLKHHDKWQRDINNNTKCNAYFMHFVIIIFRFLNSDMTRFLTEKKINNRPFYSFGRNLIALIIMNEFLLQIDWQGTAFLLQYILNNNVINQNVHSSLGSYIYWTEYWSLGRPHWVN